MREGNDLHYEMHIPLKEALIGFSTTIKHFDAHEVTVQRSGVTPTGAVEKIAGEGMPEHNFASEKGDLYVHFVVDFPKELSDAQKQCAETF